MTRLARPSSFRSNLPLLTSQMIVVPMDVPPATFAHSDESDRAIRSKATARSDPE